MPFFTRAALFSHLICFGISLHAGTPGEPANFAGFYAGFGGSYIYTTVSGATTISMSTSSYRAVYTLNTALTNHQSPLVNAGYFYDLHNNWLVGLKGLYKYIGVNQFDQSWSAMFPTSGTSQSAGLHTKLIQDFSLLFTGGYQFNKWLLYGGVGPGGTTTQFKLNGTVLAVNGTNPVGVNLDNTKTILSAASQVGVQYSLPNRFSVDLSYNFMVQPTSGIPTLYFPSIPNTQYSAFSHRVHVVEQGFNVTLNKYF